MTRSHFGSVVYLDRGLYRVFWTEDGRRRSKRIHGTRDDAEAFLARIVAGGSVIDCTYDRYWAEYVEPTFGGLQPKTVQGYRQVWRHDLQPAIGRTMVGATDWRLVERVLSPLTPAGQRKAYRLWSKICNMAVRDGLLDRSPVDRSIRLKPHRKREKVLYSPAEVVELLTIYGGKYRHLLALELGAGLRHEEACAVMRSDVAQVDGRAVVSVSKALIVVDGRRYLKDTKTALSTRSVALGWPFADVLGECWMPADEGELVSPMTATHNWRGYCRKNGWKYVPFGDMRSNFATLACECCDSSLVSLMMGHSDGTTRGRNYQQSTLRGMAIVADCLSEYLAEQSGAEFAPPVQAFPQVR